MGSSELDPTAGGLPDLDALIQGVEEACFSRRPLSEKELQALDAAYAGREGVGKLGEEHARLRGFGHRLWYACGAPGASGIAGAPEAKLRQLACTLFASGCCTSTRLPDEQVTLAAQWALAGRAWATLTNGGDNGEAIRCFEAATAPWVAVGFHHAEAKNAGATKLAQVAFQAYSWWCEALFKQNTYGPAFDALAKAKDTLTSSMELRGVALEEFLQTCCEHAATHRQAGNVALAIDHLTLALAASEPADGRPMDENESAGKAVLLRQLALCYAALPDRARALVHAQAAASLGCHRAASLLVWFRVVLLPAEDACHETSRTFPDVETEIRSVVDELTRHPDAPVGECLAACGMLLDNGWEHLAATCLADLGTRVSNDPDARVEVLLFRLRLSAQATDAALGVGKAPDDPSALKTTQERLREVLADVDAEMASARPQTLQHESVHGEGAPHGQHGKRGLGHLAETVLGTLNKLAFAAQKCACYDEALSWLHRMISLLRARGEPRETLAHHWSVVAVCEWRAGHREEARSAAEKALALEANHLQATVVALLSSAAAVAQSGSNLVQTEKWEKIVRPLLLRVQAHSALSPKLAKCVLQALLQYQAPMNLISASLELLARSLVKADPSAATERDEAADEGNVFDGLAVVGALVERGAAAITAELARPCKEGSGELEVVAREFVRYVDVAAEHVLLRQGQLVSALSLHEGDQVKVESGGGTGVEDLHMIVNTAWAQALALGRGRCWEPCSQVLDGLQHLLQHLESGDIQAILEARAWCLTVAASAALQHAKELVVQPRDRDALHQRALFCIDRANHASRRLARPQRHRLDGATGLEGNDNRMQTTLALLELEVRCLCGNPEFDLKSFVDEVSSGAGQGRILPALARIAANAKHRRLAIHGFERYLRVCCASAADSHCAAVQREIIGLHPSRNESFNVYEGILNLLGIADDAAGSYPRSEIMWLVATSWNNGAHFFRLQQYKWAERWMGKSLAFAKFCQGAFREDKMISHYIKCCEYCTE